ncbi:MAG TPA: winged helix DNA-binding domain-containing protein, partial [Micromonosporaceae bacterium]|nr:winged helix DNA-binding domain-containing protein [Micromonosporaceae bacterium]
FSFFFFIFFFQLFRSLQAQDEWVAAYAIRPRTKPNVNAATVSQTPGLICTWAMRGTLHLVTADDAAWLVNLLGPRFIAKQRGRRHQLGLTDEMLDSALPLIRELVPASRAEIAKAVRKAGIDLPEGQAEAHLISVAAMSGLIHRTTEGYEPLTHKGSEPDDPPRELARRYLEGYAPAEPEDFAVWSGLPLTEARRAFAHLEQPPIRAQKASGIRLLGHWDPFLLGYRDRSFTLDPAHAKHIQRGGGFLQPIVLVDGQVEGTWSREWKGDQLIVNVESFGAEITGLEQEIADLKRFFERDRPPR